jgi:hypothetical protein
LSKLNLGVVFIFSSAHQINNIRVDEPNLMRINPSLLKYPGLPKNVLRRKQPVLQVEPINAEELLEYRILLASSGSNRRSREHKFTVPASIQVDLDMLCDDPVYNKMSAGTRAKPPEVLLKVEKRGGNMYMLTIAASELMPDDLVVQRLGELAAQDALLVRNAA